ncbi:S8 family peptidase [Bradyrhizobium sp. USDA 4501]
MIEPALAAEDCHTIKPTWGCDDTPAWQGHGTRMAGVGLYGDLVPLLVGSDPIALPYRLESVRILPPEDEANDPELYGAVTGEAIARAEIQAPTRRRAIAMAVTSANPARERPTSWSAAVDQLCFEEDQRRLIILSAGNIAEDLTPADHLTRNDLEAIDDPAQAWNALTVGAYTEKVDIIDPKFAGYAPIAPAGELSPRSRTSVVWDRQWPVKPDVVFEGGNLAAGGTSAKCCSIWADGSTRTAAARLEDAARGSAESPSLCWQLNRSSGKLQTGSGTMRQSHDMVTTCWRGTGDAQEATTTRPRASSRAEQLGNSA